MEFSRQEYWSGLPFPSPEDLPDPETGPTSLASPALAGGFFTIPATREALLDKRYYKFEESGEPDFIFLLLVIQKAKKII